MDGRTSPGVTLLATARAECVMQTRCPQATKTLGPQSSFDKLRQYGHMPLSRDDRPDTEPTGLRGADVEGDRSETK
jgi:hypothetical protein